MEEIKKFLETGVTDVTLIVPEVENLREEEELPTDVKVFVGIYFCQYNGGNLREARELTQSWVKNPQKAESLKATDSKDESFGTCPFCGEMEIWNLKGYPEIQNITHNRFCMWEQTKTQLWVFYQG